MNMRFAPGMAHKFIKPGTCGQVAIVHDRPDKLSRLRGAMQGMPLDCDVYTRLLIDNDVWMTDAEFEWRTNIGVVSHAVGDVLIAGLGIGFIIKPILDQPEVLSVTVLENNPNVIKLVAPQLAHNKLQVIEADATTWRVPPKKYDCIYLDIWANVPNSDDRADIKLLKQKYRKGLRKGGTIAAWCERYSR